MVLRRLGRLRSVARGLGIASRPRQDGAVVGDVGTAEPSPVVLVHGYLDSERTPWWDVLAGYLEDAGWPADRVHRVSIGDLPGTTVGSPTAYADRVQAELERLHDAHDEPASVLCHSMGGLDTRWCVEQGDGAPLVDDVVTLGTPHRGTYAAYLGLLTAGGRDMLPGSTLVETLTEDGLEPSVRYTAVASTADELVVPSRNALIPEELVHGDTRNVEVDSLGHVEHVHDPDVFREYVERLA